MIRVHFIHDESRRKKLDKDVATTVTGGQIDVVPNQRYRVAAYQFHVKTKFSEGTERADFEYAADQARVPVLKRRVSENPEMKSTLYGSGSFRYVDTFEIDYNGEI